MGKKLGRWDVDSLSVPGDAEMNTTEKLYLPVDGIFEMFNSLTGHHPSVLQSPAFIPVLQHPNVSKISKSGMGIIKTVKGRWRQQDKSADASRSSSSGNPRVPGDRLPKRSVDLLEMGLTKPKNCHRIVVLGAAKVGKSSILRRFLGRDFEEDYEPTVEDFHRKLYHIEGESYQLDLLDAARERDFPAKRRLSILTGDIFLLVFSVDDSDSFREVCDLGTQRAVSESAVTGILGDDVPFFETSAKDGTGLEDAFKALASLGGLPDETSPSRHQIVSILTYQSLCVGGRARRGSRTPGLGAPCAAVDPLARRPSFTSDLRLVTRETRPA